MSRPELPAPHDSQAIEIRNLLARAIQLAQSIEEGIGADPEQDINADDAADLLQDLRNAHHNVTRILNF